MPVVIHGTADVYVRRAKHKGNSITTARSSRRGRSSLRAVTGKTADWNEIAKDCIAVANATGGRLRLGIEDGQDVPPASQRAPTDLPDILRRKLASERSALPWETPITLHGPRVEEDAAKRKRLLQALRAADRVRFETTGQITLATGTDVKPLEVLLFMRDVRSKGCYDRRSSSVFPQATLSRSRTRERTSPNWLTRSKAAPRSLPRTARVTLP